MLRVQQWALGLVVALVAAAPAAAQEPGVTIDPSSPSAKQYVLPLEGARRQADPKQRQSAPVQQGTTKSQLFGAGVTSSGSGGSGGGGSSAEFSTTGSGAKSGARSTTANGGKASLPPAVRAAVVDPGAPGRGIGTTALLIGGSLLVLLAGAGIGIAARRRRA